MQYYRSIRNNWSSESTTSIQLRFHYVRVVFKNGDSPRQYGGNCNVRGQQPCRPLTQLQLPPQRPHQHNWQMNFQVGFSMNCPMRLGLSDTTCPQRLWEQNPIKVVFVLYNSEPSRSPSCKSPVFLLVPWHQRTLWNTIWFLMIQICHNVSPWGRDQWQVDVQSVN
jgi:hypothetical protein